ncbi:uncharacterized protein [Halyomorpha halys]|uniref:uncharacterized protein n=1 Tax=Halyomorpha halys TaxID=286706 RepID=UPI0006D4DAD3
MVKPDTCGIDGFGFQIKRTNETAWKTGNGTKEEIFWTFWDRGRKAKVGDVFDFSARVWYGGIPYTYPSNKWTVPELVEEFTDPPHAEMEDNCIQTTETPKKKIKEVSKNTETTREPKKLKSEEQDQQKTVPTSGMCTWVDPPKNNSTKEEVLEKQLAMLQCEMSAFLDRTSKLTSELNKELLDLKKLNYAAVARMQRLESLIRTIPRSIPYPYV